MQYFSTRGETAPVSFTKAVMMGLAEDGGLLLPRTIPRIGNETLSSWENLSYAELAFEVMSRFIDDIPENDLKALINRSYASFEAEDVAPLVHHGDLHILELFHGPTLAFKDIALQFLGNLFEYLLEKDDKVLNIIGATSGDTGSAAIYGVRGKERIRIFILHPHNRVSPVQEKQMTSILDDNVFNIAIEGSFDDGQAIVKKIFGDLDLKKEYSLGAINSINWARVLAQVVYYIYSYLHVRTHEKMPSMDFTVPTGNFGDIFAGYIAKRMLPEGAIRQLVLATNQNDILNRFVGAGDYSLSDVAMTTSPSMDIQAASNFERYLYYLMDSEAGKTKELMEQFSQEGKIDLSDYLDQIRRDFSSVAVSNEEVSETISDFYNKYDYVLDPHTAVGVKAAGDKYTVGVPMVCLSTAHPAKFPDAVHDAIGRDPEVPPSIDGILERESRCQVLAADAKVIVQYIKDNAKTAQKEQ
ncbi:threonine synthase [Desulfotalea psychrophila]|uniref:Threonine synthase n=1 Tax=Desulfotalea psychrophila (strain LSv54 / DSM 12343) TaxID=177439 RepID=Q6AJX8_DESPS|nr:threonine synthase [Desulfotalea psychrophila]CAG37348.1 probable threonine synthase [Desulfotalea psychrophila LSv54]